MFVIVHNNAVILGPMRWSKFKFQTEILEETETEVELPDTLNEAIIISKELQILPVVSEQNPDYNSRTEFLNGPYWEFTKEKAIQSYKAEKLPVEAVNNMLKEQISDERKVKEKLDVKVTIDDVEYIFDSSKETRSALQQALLSNIDEFNWKLSRDNWIVLNNESISLVLNSIIQHVQNCFDWERLLISQVDLCETLEELDSILIKEPVDGRPNNQL